MKVLVFSNTNSPIAIKFYDWSSPTAIGFRIHSVLKEIEAGLLSSGEISFKMKEMEEEEFKLLETK